MNTENNTEQNNSFIPELLFESSLSTSCKIYYYDGLLYILSKQDHTQSLLTYQDSLRAVTENYQEAIKTIGKSIGKAFNPHLITEIEEISIPKVDKSRINSIIPVLPFIQLIHKGQEKIKYNLEAAQTANTPIVHKSSTIIFSMLDNHPFELPSYPPRNIQNNIRIPNPKIGKSREETELFLNLENTETVIEAVSRKKAIQHLSAQKEKKRAGEIAAELSDEFYIAYGIGRARYQILLSETDMKDIQEVLSLNFPIYSILYLSDELSEKAQYQPAERKIENEKEKVLTLKWLKEFENDTITLHTKHGEKNIILKNKKEIQNKYSEILQVLTTLLS